jgi:hypothetical protein
VRALEALVRRGVGVVLRLFVGEEQERLLAVVLRGLLLLVLLLLVRAKKGRLLRDAGERGVDAAVLRIIIRAHVRVGVQRALLRVRVEQLFWT